MSERYNLVGSHTDCEEPASLIGVFKTRQDAEKAAVEAHLQDPQKQWVFIIETRWFDDFE